ncbi:MAG: hypothetical protein J0H57_12660 [Rhodospirillales bacterium]|nr:hypothetical protein [Rhodospirillales bacterium]
MTGRQLGSCVWLLALLLPASCGWQDSQTAEHGQQVIMGMSRPDLEACLGVPDQHDSLGDTDILTWNSTSTAARGVSVGLPVLGDLSLSGGGSCHAVVRLERGVVTEVRYTGENGAPLAPQSYCAPIVRSCVAYPEPRRGAVPAPGP